MRDKPAALLALAVLLVAVWPATMGVYAQPVVKKDPRDATNENPDFDIRSFGIAGKMPYVQVYGQAGRTLTTEPEQIYAYLIYADNGIWAVNSHGFSHGDPEAGQWHSEQVIFDDPNNPKCLVGFNNISESRMDGTHVFIVGSGATLVSKAQTVELVHVMEDPEETECPGSIARLVQVFDTAQDEDDD